MTEFDPLGDARAELARVPAPTAGELGEQRAGMEAAMHGPGLRRRRFPSRRWLPASGIAVAGLAVAILLAAALQPGGSGDDDGPASERSRFQLVTSAPGGAFAGLDLDSASAAEVLRAAGRAAADGVPESGGWSYTRSESGSADFPVTIMERWTSPDGERSFAVSSIHLTNPDHGPVGRTYSVQYEHLAEELIGDVSWREQPDGSYERRANWHNDAGDGQGSIARLVELTRLLRDTRDADDVRDALDESVEGAKLRFEEGMACSTDPKFGSCSTSGLLPQAKGLDEEASRRLYLTGQLLTVTVSNVFPPAATRAIYEYLASLPEARVAPAKDGSGEVVLSLRVKGPSFTTHRTPSTGQGVGYETRLVPGSTSNTKAVAAIDPSTGRLVQLNPEPTISDMTVRYTRFGIAPGPGEGGEICKDYALPCEDARDLERRLQSDPNARFEGVVDWMFISQFCDGVINRDGSPRQGGHRPLSASNDPEVKAKREACERREARAATEG